VRAALARAVDRRRLAEVGGEAVVAVEGPPGDAKAAREALERAGWKAGTDGVMQRGERPLRFVLATSDRPERVALAEELTRQLEPTGARVEVQKVGWGGFVADVLAPGKFGAALVQTFEPAASPDPGRLWGRGAPLNVGGWSSQRGEELLATARRATTPEARAAALREWQAVFDTEVPGVRLLHPALSYPVAVEMKGQTLPPIVLPRDRFASYPDWFLFTRRVPGRF
jgi:ABC-type transport system substrate-binding protein